MEMPAEDYRSCRALAPAVLAAGLTTLLAFDCGSIRPDARTAAATIEGSNGFKTHEIFHTSTTATTGYDAYATWDATNLYFGYTGQDVGAPACAPDEAADCPVYARGQSASKYVVYYLDTDPQGGRGTTRARPFGGQRWTLPFAADYAILIRTDYDSTRVAGLYSWSGAAWTDQGPGALTVADNDGSKFLEFAVARSAVGDPCFVRVASWFFSTAHDLSYAYWPANAVAGLPPEGAAAAAPHELAHYYGFVLLDGQTPNASGGQANLDRPFPDGYRCGRVNGNATAGAHPGSAAPFHSIGFTTSNDFSDREIFSTSTTAATGYDAYATWDATNLYFGYTGSDLGPGDCRRPAPGSADPGAAQPADTAATSRRATSADERFSPGDVGFVQHLTAAVREERLRPVAAYRPAAPSGATQPGATPSDTSKSPPEHADCRVYETGQSHDKWVVYYLDTDPRAGGRGTQEAMQLGGQRWTLPFAADYSIWIRTDGVTNDRGYTGVADLKKWDGRRWTSRGPGALEIFLNSTSGFLKFAVPREALGGPDFVRATSWFVDAGRDTSYAYWPANAVAAAGTDTSATELQHAYGFVLVDGQIPNASRGQANLDRPFFPGLEAAPVNGDAVRGRSGSAPRPFHSIGLHNSNDFSENEIFRTATSADTGYDAYFTWDATNLYLGYTGSDVGPGDCDGTDESDDCSAYETGQTPHKWLVYYLDTDPTGTRGTDGRQHFGDQSWTLPFRADYAILLRTDGLTVEGQYTGVADLRRWNGAQWASLGARELEIFDNSTSGFLKIAVGREALGRPDRLKVVGWFFDLEGGIGYGYWPRSAAADSAGATAGHVRLTDYLGFDLRDGQTPNASDGLANLDRPFFGPYVCPDRFFDEGGRAQDGGAQPFHTLVLDGSNGFNTEREAFATSTTVATGYTTYATWDRRRLYLGLTGSNVGPGDCSDAADAPCSPAETGQGPTKWIVYYLDTDPTGDGGTTRAYTAPDTLGTQQTWTLPFRADYAVLLRTDGQTVKAGHTGIVEMKAWTGRRWASRGPCGVEVWDNNGSGFLALALDLASVGYPHQVRLAGWVFDETRAYAYWPAGAASDGAARGRTLESWWGFTLRGDVVPNDTRHLRRTFEAGASDQVTYNTYALDGRRAAHEQLPAESLGREDPASPAGPDNPELFVTWDEANLYLSLEGGVLAGGRSDLFVAFDFDTTAGDPRGGAGLHTHPRERDGGGRATYPFAADLVYRFAGTDAGGDTLPQHPAPGRRYVPRSNRWAAAPLSEDVQVFRRPAGAPTEVALPWADLERQTGRTIHAFRVLFYLADAGNAFDAQWPPGNPNGDAVVFDRFRTYTRVRGTAPFSTAYLAVREEGGITLGRPLYGSVYLVPTAAQTTTLGANTTVVDALYVGPEATLAVGTHQGNPSGFDRLRVGRRLTVRGTLDAARGEVVTFDPARGYAETQQPDGGFARPSRATEIVCGTRFHVLTLRNETHLRRCPDDGAPNRFVVEDTLQVAAGGALHSHGNRIGLPEARNRNDR